jgi:2-phospho-L-lactate guanylyltransferase
VSGTWAVVPVKAFERGKSRLAAVLDAEAREALARSLFERVAGALAGCEGLAGVLVATDSDEVAEVARGKGFEPLLDATPRAHGDGALGTVIDRALLHVETRGATSALVVMSDLPLVETRDLEALIQLLADRQPGDGQGVIVVPDAEHEGTNALALARPTLLRTCFGRYGSFALHCEEARRVGVRALVLENQHFGLDIDAPADLEMCGLGVHAKTEVLSKAGACQ